MKSLEPFTYSDPLISGKFKGYGLVRYTSKASSLQARHVLEGRIVRGGHALDCDWLKCNTPTNVDSTETATVSLHSKCLFIDNLPKNYRDMGEFRRLFSTIVNPPYCQVKMAFSLEFRTWPFFVLSTQTSTQFFLLLAFFSQMEMGLQVNLEAHISVEKDPLPLFPWPKFWDQLQLWYEEIHL